MILPHHLKIGDTIGIIASASPPDMKKLHKAILFFKQMGLRVKLGKHIEKVHGYLAGTDAERLADFHDMVADPTINAIFFARGGYGTGRIANDIDYDLIKQNPKIIWGYSDITYLHTAIRQATGLVTFHGPMPASDVADQEFDTLTASMFQQLFQPTKLTYTEEVAPLNVLVPGETAGSLVGGNLSLIASTLGTPFEIDTKAKILLLEDVGEVPYSVDSMLNQLKMAGKFDAAAGVVVGDFAEAEPKKDKPSLTLEQVFQDYLGQLNCPVMSGFKIGHCFPHFAVPLGVNAVLSTSDKTLTIDPGVK
ncbi:LD-carboxypeptidase [Virgibacillus kekensis]|uniref:LD-carboxypeptidase n=1 Tax=Virgibacillus kekensis TaxID=202261 RepID=A0ABV9DHJ7_9BACI